MRALGLGRMGQWVKVSATKSDDWSSTPEPSRSKERTDSHEKLSDLPPHMCTCRAVCTCLYAYDHIQN